MQILKYLLDALYPPLCPACEDRLGANEGNICMACLNSMPRTGYHLFEGNAMEKVFYGRVPIQFASAWVFFQKGGRVQNLLHNIKYKRQKMAAYEAGLQYGLELKAANAHICQASSILPVPLHPKKLRKRGFNQSLSFAEGLSASLQIPVDSESLKRIVNTETQTKKTRLERIKNVEGVFAYQLSKEVPGRHLILVDDVITTGATLETCAQTILSVNCSLKISVLALAMADS